MPLSYTGITAGLQAKSAQLKQVLDLLTGVMTDQQATLTHASATPLLVNRTDAAAANKGYIVAQRAGATKWWLGMDASDQFNLLNAAGSAANIVVTDAGAMTVRAGLTATTINASALISGAASINITSGTLQFSGQTAISGNVDTWLRLNNSNTYTSGVYTPGVLRADGALQGWGSGTGSGTAGLYLNATNPYILSGGGYTVVPNGIYISAAFYVSAAGVINVRTGLSDDQHTYVTANQSLSQPTTPSGNAAGLTPVKLYDGTGLTSGTGAVTIPTGIRSVEIFVSVVGDTDVAVQFNGDTATNYSWGVIESNTGANPTGTGSNSVSYIRVGYSGGTYGCVSKVSIPDVKASASTLRAVVASSIRSDSTTGWYNDLYVGHWVTTATAITSITVKPSSGSWSSGMVTIWGYP